MLEASDGWNWSGWSQEAVSLARGSRTSASVWTTVLITLDVFRYVMSGDAPNVSTCFNGNFGFSWTKQTSKQESERGALHDKSWSDRQVHVISFMSPWCHLHLHVKVLGLFVLGSPRAETKGPRSLSSGTMYRDTLGPNFGRVNGQQSTPHDPGETSVEGGVSIEMPLCWHVCLWFAKATPKIVSQHHRRNWKAFHPAKPGAAESGWNKIRQQDASPSSGNMSVGPS